MPELNQAVNQGRRRSIVRTNTVGGKFTDLEAKALAKRAAEGGQLLGEWAREALLAAGRQQQQDSQNALTRISLPSCSTSFAKLRGRRSPSWEARALESSSRTCCLSAP